jgi:hypothetical protein
LLPLTGFLSLRTFSASRATMRIHGLESENISYDSRSGCIFCIHSAVVEFDIARTVG